MDRSDRVRSRSATPSESARWWVEKIGGDHQFDVEEGVAVGSRAITIVLTHGKPDPNAFGHMALHLPSMDVLRAALTGLHERGVELEDPGDEIGPETEGSPNMGWWFRDLDGYRWELGRPKRRRATGLGFAPLVLRVAPQRFVSTVRDEPADPPVVVCRKSPTNSKRNERGGNLVEPFGDANAVKLN